MISALSDLNTIQDAKQLIEQAEKITLLTHYNPDGDGVSACAALAHAFEQQGKQVETIYPTPTEENITRQPTTVLINEHKQIPDLIIATDTPIYKRLYFPDAFTNIPLINIDHHLGNELNGTCNFVAPEVSSASELVYFLLLHWVPKKAGSEHEPDISTYIAECIMYGILYDTQGLYNQGTKPTTLRVVAELVQYHGVNLFSIQRELMSKEPEVMKFWGKLLSSVSFSPSKQAAWISVTKKMLDQEGLSFNATVGLSNFLAQFLSVDATVLFYESRDGKAKASLRSKTIDVCRIANQCGGGGHKNAAGITSDNPLDVLVSEVTAQLISL